MVDFNVTFPQRLRESAHNTLDATLTWRLVVAVVGVVAIGVTILSIYLPVGMRQASIDSAASAGHELLREVQITRSYYNDTVVQRLQQRGDIDFTDEHLGKLNALPLPATFTKELLGRISRSGYDVRLYSPYPWLSRPNPSLDSFQKMAWDELQNEPNKIIRFEENVDGQRILRLAIADRLNSKRCIECHNTSANSPRKDWKLGDVRGVLEISRKLDDDLIRVNERADKIILAVIAAALLMAASLVLIARIVDARTEEKREAQQHILHIAQHDSLTGLMNRAHFLKMVEHAISAQGFRPGGVTVFYVNLDHFKEINDGFGHAVGDHLLKVVGERLKQIMDANDYIARFGGDEFTAASLNCPSAEQAQAIGNAIVSLLNQPISIGESAIVISASVGIVIGNPSFATATEMVRAADVALSRAKESGKNCAILYSQEMDADHIARRELEKVIRENVELERVEVFFQPIVQAHSSIPSGFEALVRMRDCNGDLISPARFIPLAEEMGLINRIGLDVLRKACRAAAAWPSHLSVSVNLSPVQFVSTAANSEPISAIVAQTLTETGLAPYRLELEITEGIFLDQTEDILRELNALRALGVNIVMDDFGTGYSSLAYLWKFPFNKLKIDQSFVRLLDTGDAKMTSFIRTIASLGHTLDMRVTAEGVETAEQAAYLRVLGVDELQGYYFGKPQPAAAYHEWIFGANADRPMGPDHQRRPSLSSHEEVPAGEGSFLAAADSPSLAPGENRMPHAPKPSAQPAQQMQAEPAGRDMLVIEFPSGAPAQFAAHASATLDTFMSAVMDRYARKKNGQG